ncbi:MAG TPA: O-antigen ligase family protein [Bryobacteraceae bacterium]|nr:O-antigen ligase family protein [Bryobacteraceae bacterium]
MRFDSSRPKVYRLGYADKFDAETRSAAVLLSCTIAFLIPLLLGVYWFAYAFDTDLATRILRPAVIGSSLLLALIWTKPALTWAELRLGAIISVMCVVLLAPSLAATDPRRALEDCLKLAILCFIALLVCRALRDKTTAEAFGRSLILTSILTALLTVYVYLKYMGWTLPTYESSRVLKSVAIQAGIPLNAVAFACVFSYICGMCLVPRSRLLTWGLGPSLFVISSALTGSRAPLGLLAVSGMLLLIFNGLVSNSLTKRTMAWLSVAVLVVAIAWGVKYLTFKDVSSATEGRWDFWTVAWDKFTERPLMGYGFDSWRDDLVSRLPGEYKLTAYDAINLAGGYHNEYITLLAEQGLVGFFPVMALFIFLWRCSWNLAFRSPSTWKNGQWAFFGCLFLLLRGSIEAPGLFGYGQEPADYLAFIFLAIVVSRFSVQEDYLKFAQATLQSEPYRQYAAAYA